MPEQHHQVFDQTNRILMLEKKLLESKQVSDQAVNDAELAIANVSHLKDTEDELQSLRRSHQAVREQVRNRPKSVCEYRRVGSPSLGVAAPLSSGLLGGRGQARGQAGWPRCAVLVVLTSVVLTSTLLQLSSEKMKTQELGLEVLSLANGRTALQQEINDLAAQLGDQMRQPIAAPLAMPVIKVETSRPVTPGTGTNPISPPSLHHD